MFITCPIPSCPSNAGEDAPKRIHIDPASRFCPGCGKSLSDLKIPVEFLFDQLERAHQERSHRLKIPRYAAWGLFWVALISIFLHARIWVAHEDFCILFCCAMAFTYFWFRDSLTWKWAAKEHPLIKTFHDWKQ
jgi:hypothetical protein